jgi:hypothetical protein
MLQISKKEIVAQYSNKKTVQIIYKGLHIIWQGIRSCFGSGAWHNEKPWLNDESWKNN